MDDNGALAARALGEYAKQLREYPMPAPRAALAEAEKAAELRRDIMSGKAQIIYMSEPETSGRHRVAVPADVGGTRVLIEVSDDYETPDGRKV